MSVSPLGNINFINQNSPVVSHVASTQQARFDIQAAMAEEISAQKEREVEEVRPTEETYRIDPEHEHEREKNNQEDEANQKKDTKEEMAENSDIKDDGELYHLDIKI